MHWEAISPASSFAEKGTRVPTTLENRKEEDDDEEDKEDKEDEEDEEDEDEDEKEDEEQQKEQRKDKQKNKNRPAIKLSTHQARGHSSPCSDLPGGNGQHVSSPRLSCEE
ncbi:hypothetical protein C0Q70_01012 [Pomacea canaliculata]|uniref:Uncharacterized protein n=1 Tax=Pomacea canaliculata TaxID=400727 RepID=A0A2T7PYC5_POMCA|nr:hypothetical protein C0Q70_01012 [Pomacea canaliculata]